MFERFLTPAEVEALKAEEAASAKEQKRTPEQIEAIYSHGQDILVSASAGSGKTYVMVERIVDMLSRGLAIKQLFISTFTVKAASELKERLEKKLRSVLATETDETKRQHLALQLADVQTADIGTMDAFSQKLVKEQGYLLGLPPKFRILQDRAEQDLFKQEVFDDLFTDYMSGNDSQAFKALVKNFVGRGKDATAFRQVVYQIYDFLQSTSNPKAWLAERFMPADQAVDWASRWRDLRLVLLVTADDLEDLTELPDYAKQTKAGKVSAAYVKDQALIAGLRDLGKTSQPLDDEGLKALLVELKALLPAGKDKTVKGVKYPIYEALQHQLADLQKTFFILDHQEGADQHLQLLRAFMEDFCDQYLAKKTAENAFEFADISHFAIAILEEQEAVRQAYQARYAEVMVDEYQDTNHTQERLLELLSRGHNRFMVGDIKQSIYRFRQADPQIFNDKFKAYQADPDQGRLILLKENFRSHKTVLETTNALFERLMDEQVGEVLYNGTHKLVAGSAGQASPAPNQVTQLLLYDNQGLEEVSKTQQAEEDQDGGATMSPGQLLMVAQEVIRLHQEEGVPFGDMTLLAPSRKSYAAIMSLFEAQGIPLQADGGKPNYLQSVDVMVMLDTLRTIYNPLNDYALVALLKSPMFSFKEDDLARLAVQADGGQFYQKLQLALAKTGHHQELVTGDLTKKLETFQTYLDKWRTYAKGHSLYDLIWQIYHDRFYYDYAGLLRNGAQRQANLYALATRAQQFEQTGFKGLPRFIHLIDKLLKNQHDLANIDLPAPKDAVSLMTIHKSKGLEFPYVFILDMNGPFNKDQERSKLIIDRQAGVGIQHVVDIRQEFEEKDRPLPDQVLVSLPTLAYEANKKRLHLANLSEQMRLLYVAMTRASRKLYLVGRANQAKQEEQAEVILEDGRLPLAKRQTIDTFQGWFLQLLTSISPASLALEVVYKTDADLVVPVLSLVSAHRLADSQANNRQSQQLTEALKTLEAVNDLNQRYQSAINLPTLQTPSQIKDVYQPVLGQEELAIMDQPKLQREVAFEPLVFGASDQVTGSALGAATHELLQRLILSPAVSRADLENALVQTQASDQVKAALDLTKLEAFFRTELGQLLQTHWDKVVREAPFAMLERDATSGEDFVVRGIVDGFVKLDDRLVLFDYKTDRYQQAKDLIARYQGQMALYAKALSQAYDQLPVEAYLVLLGGKTVEVVQVPLS